MRPRMPASWRICCLEPRALESTIMKTGLISMSLVRPFWASSFVQPFSLIALYITVTSLSAAADQTSTTLLWRSPSVMTPWRYW